jgi:hypothetical protein
MIRGGAKSPHIGIRTGENITRGQIQQGTQYPMFGYNIWANRDRRAKRKTRLSVELWREQR